MTTLPNNMKDCRASMDKGIDAVKREYSSVRSGKAAPSMLETVKVAAYGALVSRDQVASVNAPEPRALLVTPFDKAQVRAVEKAIREAGLGFDPAIQGAVIRV